MKNLLLTIMCLCTVQSMLATTGSSLTGNRASTQQKEINGARIAVADAYYCYLNNNVPVLTSGGSGGSAQIDDEAHSVGWASNISLINAGTTAIMKLYSNFSVNLHFQETVGSDGQQMAKLWFTAGTLLDRIVKTDVELTETRSANNTIVNEVKSLYAISEQWLRNYNDTAIYTINGTYDYDDGTVFFEGGIAFFIADEYISINSLTGEETLQENVSSYTLSPIYRNIHFMRPNGSQTFGSKQSSYNDTQKIELMKNYVIQADGGPAPHTGFGGGGRITRPIDPRPIKSRLLSVVEDQYPTALTGNGRRTDKSTTVHLNGWDSHQDWGDLILGVPVYLTQINDTTVYIYNMYGTISEVNVAYIHNDSTVTLPAQPIDQSTDHSVYAFYNFGDPFEIPGHVMFGKNITWDGTIPVNYQGQFPHYFTNNNISLTDGSYIYIPGSAARGDVNKDGKINIGDVTALINMLLTGESDSPVILGKDAIDCNKDENINIGDVTALINYLLSGSW